MRGKIHSLLAAGCIAGAAGPLSAGEPAADVVQLPAIAANAAASAGTDLPSALAVTAGAPAGDGLADLTRQVPGLAWNDAGARGFGLTVNLRGLGNTPYFSDASAPVYLDDIPLGSAFTFPTGLYDFSRVDVFRGPQAATRFGRAGDAGVIQLVSPEPAADASGSVRFSLGDFGAQSLTASATSAHDGQWDTSAGFGASRRDGYIRNTTLDTDVDHRESVAGRFRVRYRPTDDWEISLHLIAEQDRDGAEALVPLGGSFDTVARGKEGEADIRFAAGALGLSRRWAGGELTATSSFSDWSLSPYANRLVVFGGANLDSAITQSQRAFNEEIKFASGNLIVGGFYSHAQTDGDAVRSISGFPIENSRFQTGADTFALFGRRSFSPAPDWTVVPGLRFDSTARDFLRTEAVPASGLLRGDHTWGALLPSLTFSRLLGTDEALSLTIARGDKPGGYSAYADRADLVRFDAQSTWGVEAAYTATGGPSAWSFTARAYAYRVRGYQIERSFAVPNSASDEYLVVNADRARLLGLEMEARWRPAAHVTVTAAGALTQATLDAFTDPFTHLSYSGDRVPLAPSGNASLRADYRPGRGFFAGAGATWTGTTFYDEKETPEFAQRAYFLVDASAGYAFGRGELRAYGRNLGDQKYYRSITPGVAHGTPGAPLTWGVEYGRRW